MWNLYHKAKTFSQLPSRLLRIENDWLAYQLDNAVDFLGTIFEAALEEQRNIGTPDKPKYEPKYTLGQLLADDFRLPRPVRIQPLTGMAQLKALVGAGVTYHKG